jgi:UDP-glucose 4-epimerase
VNDVVGALRQLIGTPAAVGEVFNVGSDEEITMNALAKRVIELAGSKSAIEHVPYEKAYGQQFDDLRRRVPKLDKIRRVIGFKQTKYLDQIVQSVIEEKRKSG